MLDVSVRSLGQLQQATNNTHLDPVTSVKVAKANDSYLVSTLDSTLRLMDKRDGKLLQAFRASSVGGHAIDTKLAD